MPQRWIHSMRPVLAAFAILSLCPLASIGAAPVPGRVAPRPVGPDGRAIYTYAFLPGATTELLDRLTALGFIVEPRGPLEAVAYLSPEEADKLAALAIPWIPITEPRPGVSETDAAYHNYTQLTTTLQQVAADHPQIVRLVSAGKSVQNRELWWLRISDNPDVEEDEPAFRYISTMHGDEPIGTELLLNLIDYLTDGYATDPRAARLVNGLEIWIMPMMNPDGNALSQRFNASGVDLNRDFPEQWVDPIDTTAGRAPETAAVMNWQSGHHTSLSANFHSGALVVNYPFDSNESGLSVYAQCPDDDFMIDISLDYSENNAPMYNNPQFPQGITNGADWYVLRGGLQDWSYVYRGDVDVTVELSNTKWPPASQLGTYWNNNRESMISYLERALSGVRGVVTDAEAGTPVAARVSVVGRDVPFYTDPEVGDYQRTLLPGTYALRFEAPGYETKEIPVTVSSARGDAVRADVTLTPLPTAIAVDAHRVAADDGASGSLDAGENGRIAVTLRNDGRTASGVTGRLQSLSPYAVADDSPLAWPDLAPGEKAESPAPHFAVTVSPAAPAGHKLVFAVDWQSAGALAGSTAPFIVPVGTPRIDDRVAADTPKPINDNTTITSTINVSEDREIASADVRVDITHTYIGELRVRLEAPDGTIVRLHDRQGGSTDNLRTWYDDETAPVDTLGALAGKPTLGTWKLHVSDEGNGDTGSLLSWTLRFATRAFEDPVAGVALRDVRREPDGSVRLSWLPVGSADSYRVHRSPDPSQESAFADVTSEDDDNADLSFVDRSTGSLTCWIVSAVGHTGEGLWGHFGR